MTVNLEKYLGKTVKVRLKGGITATTQVLEYFGFHVAMDSQDYRLATIATQ